MSAPKLTAADLARATERYRTASFDALLAAQKTLAGSLPAEFSASQYSRAIMMAWREQWIPHNTRVPPKGGWDWEGVRATFRRDITRFEIAVMVGDRLCGMGIGRLNSTAAVLEAVEGDPRFDSPLKGKILLIVLQAITCYAQKTGRSEVWVMDPDPDLIPLYKHDFLFALETPRKGPAYCRRRV